jgi:hypothetical protein
MSKMTGKYTMTIKASVEMDNMCIDEMTDKITNYCAWTERKEGFYELI